MSCIVVFRSELLPISETFVRDQVTSIDKWDRALLGYSELPDGLATPGVEQVVAPAGTNKFNRLARYLLERPNERICNQLVELGASLVHAHFGTDAVSIWPSVKALGLPMLVTLHGADIRISREWWESGKAGIRGRLYPKRLIALAEEKNVGFIAVSESIKRRAVEFGIPENKIFTSYIGVNTSRFSPDASSVLERSKRILFTGRMVEKKAPLLLVRAFSNVKKRIPKAELVMVGDGPLLDETKALARSLGVDVDFMGAQKQEEVRSQLGKARVFCLPSVTAANGDAEGLPIAILEAAACGVPVVTSALGGADEGVVDGETGYCFDENDEVACASALCTILENDELAGMMSLRARAHVVEKFDITRCTERLNELYQSSLDAGEVKK